MIFVSSPSTSIYINVMRLLSVSHTHTHRNTWTGVKLFFSFEQKLGKHADTINKKKLFYFTMKNRGQSRSNFSFRLLLFADGLMEFARVIK